MGDEEISRLMNLLSERHAATSRSRCFSVTESPEVFTAPHMSTFTVEPSLKEEGHKLV